ncbi:MAG: VCBS repeat-containing protein [Planctomycetes bacterium]|nr:VCBS repeat-containing protein [Planctomycetota bacterium]
MIMSRTRSFLVALLGFGLAAAAQELAPPQVLECAGRPIDVEVGHAAPWVQDLDGDGLADLLVGQFGDGKLRIYRNRGRVGAPRYENFEYLVAGGREATVPAG